MQNIYWSISKALEVYPIIQSDLVIADSVLTDGAYVDIAEAVKLGKAIDVNTSKSADYWNAYDALETSLAVQHSSQIAMEIGHSVMIYIPLTNCVIIWMIPMAWLSLQDLTRVLILPLW